jgi:hypothetical protein
VAKKAKILRLQSQQNVIKIYGEKEAIEKYPHLFLEEAKKIYGEEEAIEKYPDVFLREINKIYGKKGAIEFMKKYPHLFEGK